MWRKKVTANDLKHTASSVKHGGGGVMAWACMAASGTGPLNFTDDLMYDDSSRMNLEGYKTILPTNIEENATRLIGKCFILHQDKYPKHPASSVKDFIRAKKWKVLPPVSQTRCTPAMFFSKHVYKNYLNGLIELWPNPGLV